MPLRNRQSPQLITLLEALAIVKTLKAKGVPVEEPIKEITVQGVTIPVDDENYFDDGQPHEFITTVWGQPATLGLIKNVLETEEPLHAYLKIAESAFSNPVLPLEYAKVYDAILNLPPVRDAVTAALKA